MNENNTNNHVDSPSMRNRKLVAFMICLCIIGGVTIFSLNSDKDKAANSDKDAVVNQDTGTTDGKDQAVSSPVPVTDSKSTGQSADDNGNGAADTHKSGKMIMPVSGGTITNKFSEQALEYSKTLDQYVVHPGIDIEAPLDTPVVAALDGTVIKVFKDDKYGMCIWISHNDGLVTKYCNLTTDKLVGEGDVVKQGTVISGVGRSAVFESIESPHLHFEVEKDGVAIDPEEMF